MFSEGFGNALAALVVSGIAMLVIVGVFAPPLVFAGAAWLVGPRFGFEVDFLPWFAWSVAGWVPLFALWIRFAR